MNKAYQDLIQKYSEDFYEDDITQIVLVEERTVGVPHYLIIRPNGFQVWIFNSGNSNDIEPEELAPGGEMYFHVTPNTGDDGFMEPDESGVISINPKFYWDKERCLYDQHMAGIFDIMPVDFEYDEVSENMIMVSDDLDSIREKMLSAGFTENKDFSDFMNQNL